MLKCWSESLNFPLSVCPSQEMGLRHWRGKSNPRTPDFPFSLLGITLSGKFMVHFSTLTYTAKLILWSIIPIFKPGTGWVYFRQVCKPNTISELYIQSESYFEMCIPDLYPKRSNSLTNETKTAQKWSRYVFSCYPQGWRYNLPRSHLR